MSRARRSRPLPASNPHPLSYVEYRSDGVYQPVEPMAHAISKQLQRGLARFSHTNKCIGAPNQRKFFCEKDFPEIRGRPDDDRL